MPRNPGTPPTNKISKVRRPPAPVREKPMPGNPTTYRVEYDEQARKLCLMGAIDHKLAEFFEVSDVTIDNWKLRHPSFKAALKAGKDVADAEIAQSLFHRAKGYSQKSTKVVIVNGKVQHEEITENFPPDTQAAMNWLKNRQPALWKDRVDVAHSGNVSALTPEEVDERLARLVKQANIKR